MMSETIKTDKRFAQKIYEELQSGNLKAINKICKAYNQRFYIFTKIRLSDPNQAESFLTEFWKMLSDGKILCQYIEFKKNISLQTFLLNILTQKIYEKNHETDKAEADRICNELRAGNQNAIKSLIKKYHCYLIQKARIELYSYNTDPHQIEEVVNNVWIAISSKNKKGEYRICKFNGKCTLKTYLTGFLNNKLNDEKQKILLKINNMEQIFDPEKKEENGLKKRNQQELIHEALLQLEELSQKDARLMMMYFKGLNFREMAMEELKDIRNITKDDIRRKHDAIRQYFNRAESSPLTKFKIILEQLIEKHELEYDDLLD